MVDVLTFVGTFGLFFTLFLLFLRFLPIVAMAEVKTAMPESDPHHYEGDGQAAATRSRGVPYIKPSQGYQSYRGGSQGTPLSGDDDEGDDDEDSSAV
jgi:molybdopterin-containing oxidoreductase family membrane subunit